MRLLHKTKIFFLIILILLTAGPGTSQSPKLNDVFEKGDLFRLYLGYDNDTKEFADRSEFESVLQILEFDSETVTFQNETIHFRSREFFEVSQLKANLSKFGSFMVVPDWDHWTANIPSQLSNVPLRAIQNSSESLSITYTRNITEGGYYEEETIEFEYDKLSGVRTVYNVAVAIFEDGKIIGGNYLRVSVNAFKAASSDLRYQRHFRYDEVKFDVYFIPSISSSTSMTDNAEFTRLFTIVVGILMTRLWKTLYRRQERGLIP